ncbi:OB-fold domain-containing protein [Pseudalkalibacillus hwajinpoensis]|uniref:OB-fold domain-containing protein n=1 Tax=Guptibacillus hwajinpoensis TaxID=208199 RepID=UPI00325ACB2E
MKGILAYEVYLPHHRMSRKEVANFHGSYAGKGTKTVAHFDEDSLTMAVNASFPFRKYDPKAVYFASTTSPYQEKLSSVTIAKALQLPASTRTIDYGSGLRAATNAFLSGLDAVKAGPVLLTMSDRRLTKPKSPLEAEMGAGAVSFMLGTGDGVIAELVASANNASEEVSQWRTSTDAFLRQWEDRFVAYAATESVRACAEEVLSTAKTSLEEIDHVVVSGPSQKLSLNLAKSLGVDQKQVSVMNDSLIGHLGTANGPMMLVKALSVSKPNQKILWLQIGDGCEGLLLETTDSITSYQAEKPLSYYDNTMNDSVSYSDYVRWYELFEVDEGRRPGAPTPSAPALKRNQEQNMGLIGSKCESCGQTYYPKQRVCVKCHQKDNMSPFSLQGKKAKVATYTVDYLASSVSPPSIFAVVDIEGGSRMLAQVTDCKPEDISIGIEVEFSFRKLYEAGGIHNYFWKVVPKRGVHHES